MYFKFWQVSAVVNRGKDFTRDTIEIKAFADPGAYVAFAALPLDLYKRGLNDGLNEWTVSIIINYNKIREILNLLCKIALFVFFISVEWNSLLHRPRKKYVCLRSADRP